MQLHCPVGDRWLHSGTVSNRKDSAKPHIVIRCNRLNIGTGNRRPWVSRGRCFDMDWWHMDWSQFHIGVLKTKGNRWSISVSRSVESTKNKEFTGESCWTAAGIVETRATVQTTGRNWTVWVEIRGDKLHWTCTDRSPSRDTCFATIRIAKKMSFRAGIPGETLYSTIGTEQCRGALLP